MTSIPVKTPRWRYAALVVAMTAILGSCGENSSNTSVGAGSTAPATARTQQVAITLSNRGHEKHSDGAEDFLDLRGTWPSWGNESSSIAFDSDTNRLHITQPTGDSGISLGVRRFDGQLTAGNWYSLTVQANGSGAGALLFLVDRDGQVSPAVTDANGGLMLATDNSPLSFTAPANIVGFYLQVQSEYQATTDASLVANVITQSVADPDAAPDPNAELIAIAQQWPHWDGSASQVSYDAQTDRIRIDSTEHGNAIGARKLGVGLTAGATYQLSARRNTDPNASVLLFLFDDQHRVIPFNTGTSQTPWLATTGDATSTFVAPDGIANIGIQVQSGYQVSGTAYMVPSLRIASASAPDPTETPVSPPQRPTPERPVPPPVNE